MDRRAFLKAAAGGAALAALPAPAIAARRPRGRAPRLPLIRGAEFRQSVASGFPATNGATLWTRLEGLPRSARLQVEIATDADFRRVVYRRTVVADAARDATVHHRAAHRVLRPGEQYFFRFFTCDRDSPVGRFRTARPADSREPLRVGFFSCQRYPRGYFTPHEALAREDLDLVLSLGDYIYEQPEPVEIPDRRDATGATGDGEVQTLGEYRAKYALYHSDPALLAVRAQHPLVAVWDDHEAENNYAGDRPSENPEEAADPARRRVPFAERRANAYRAFFEHMPRAAAGAPRIYGSLRLGRGAEVLLLDTRQYRDPQPCGDVTIRPCPETERNDPNRTLLGAEQKAWLKDALVRSPATWKLVANQVMMMSLDVPARSPVNPDQWDGYGAERRELLGFARDRGVRNIAFLTGDIHTFFAGQVTPSGREGVPAIDGEPVATEFVGGSMTSDGLGGGRAFADGARANNPHFVFADTDRRGYGILEARPDELLVSFKGPETVKRPGSPVRTLAQFRVRSGTPRVERIDGGAQARRRV
jgi:alkaline phosphatase D